MNAPSPEVHALQRRHFSVGWAALLVFVLLGLVLELLHGFKHPIYLDARNSTRRLMWTLGHAHGTMLALVQIAFAASIGFLREPPMGRLRWVSKGLLVAGLCMPLGFFLGGVSLHGGDPGIGIVFLPLGALALVAGLAACCGLGWGRQSEGALTSAGAAAEPDKRGGKRR